MRYAVLADIHGNLEALTAALVRIAELGADRFLCLGDIAGYNANPNECIDIVRSELCERRFLRVFCSCGLLLSILNPDLC